MRRVLLHASILLVAAALAAQALAAAPGLSRIPDVEARSLAKGDVQLRDGLAGSRNLVVISFERSQTAELDTWTETLRSVREDRPGVDGYVLLIMGDLSRPLRAIIEAAMRGRIDGDAERERFLLMYGDRDGFLAGMGIEDTSTVLVVLLDARGQPTWQWRGARTDDAAAELTAALDAP